MPHSQTIRRARSVARSRSLPAPVVMLPIVISSAMRPPQQDRDLILQILARVVVLLVDRQLLRQPERHAARDDRDLVDRIGVRQLHGEQRVPGFVDRRDPLLVLADDHRAALGAHQHLVFRKLEVEHANDLLVVARGVQRRFVHQIGQVRTREA